jgi:hypothetical protein
MSRRPDPPQPPQPEPALPEAERAELQRQGAKSAARGEPLEANPLHQPRNRPPSTGESAEVWSQRSDAWQQGHEAQIRSARPPNTKAKTHGAPKDDKP